MNDPAERAAKRIAYLAINSEVSDEHDNTRTVQEVAADIIREEYAKETEHGTETQSTRQDAEQVRGETSADA